MRGSVRRNDQGFAENERTKRGEETGEKSGKRKKRKREGERERVKESNQFAAIVFVLPPECAMSERCPIR